MWEEESNTQYAQISWSSNKHGGVELDDTHFKHCEKTWLGACTYLTFIVN